MKQLWNNRTAAKAMATLCIWFLASCGSQSPESLVKSARDYLAKGDPNAAAIQLRNALQKAPDNAEARFLLGSVLVDRRDFDGAIKELRKALDLGHPTDQVIPVLARALLDDGDAKGLVAEFGTKKLNSPEAEAAFKTTLGNAWLSLGKPKEAEAAFGAALAVKPNYASAKLGMAALQALSGNMDEARKIVEAVLAQPGAPPEASLLEAQFLQLEDKPDAARSVLEKLVEAKPDFLQGRYRLAALLVAKGEFDQASAQIAAIRKVSKQDTRAYYLEALIASRRGDLAAARASVQQVLRVLPKHVASLVLAGEIEYRARQFNQAQDYLRRALNVAPGLPYAERLLAATYVRLGNPARALEVLQLPLARGDRDPQLMGIAGEAYLAIGDFPKAAQLFAETAALDPKNAVARTRLGQVKYAAGDTDGAIRDLQAASELDPNLSAADLALIADLLRQGRFDDALAAVKRLETKNANNPLVYNLEGIVQLTKRDVPAARASFEHALQIQPDYLPSVGNLAQLDRLDKKPDVGRKRFEAILEKEPKNEQALVSYAGFVQSLGGDSQEVEALLKKAVAANPQSINARVALVSHYTRAGDLKQALLAAQDANAALPNDARTLELLGQVQMAAGNSAQAIETFNKLVTVRPGSVEPLFLLARALVVTKDYDRAIDRLREALVINPELFEAQRDIVAIYTLSGRNEQALREIKAIQRQRPKDPRGYILEGDLWANQQKWAAAESAYKAAQKQAPDNGMIATKLHAVAVSEGKEAAGDAAAEKWLHDNPKDVALRSYLAERALRKKDYKTAIRLYQAVVAQQPNNAVVLNNLAWVSGEVGDPKALSYAEKAATLAPANASVLDTLGSLLLKKGDVDRALEKLRLAAQIAPNEPEIRLHLVKALIKAGDKAGARKELDALEQASTQSANATGSERATTGAPQTAAKPSLTCGPDCAAEVAALLKTL